jgi:hypothetical protein
MEIASDTVIDPAVMFGFRPKQAPTTITIDPMGDTMHVGKVLVHEGQAFRAATPFAGADPMIGMGSEFMTLGSESSYQAHVPIPDQSDAIELVEFARRAYGLTLDQVGQVAGSSAGRTYQEYRQRPMPVQKLAQTWESLAVILELGKIDPWATKTLFQVDPDAMGLVTAREYEPLWTRFVELRRRLATTQQQFAKRLEAIQQGTDLRRIRALARTDDFDAAMRLLQGFLPETHAWTEKWRIVEGLDVLEAVRQFDEDNEVTEEWSFLANLDDDELRSFKDEAVGVLGNPHTSQSEWSAWLSGVSAQVTSSLRRLAVSDPVSLPRTPGTGQVGILDVMADGFDYTLPKRRADR